MTLLVFRDKYSILLIVKVIKALPHWLIFICLALFTVPGFGSSEKEIGIELNTKTIFNSEEEKDILLHPYYIAKDCGCKFYLGSDSHKTAALIGAKENFERIITLLALEEKHKFHLAKKQ